jgi:hypothetical protein
VNSNWNRISSMASPTAYHSGLCRNAIAQTSCTWERLRVSFTSSPVTWAALVRGSW